MTEPKVVYEWTDPTYGEQWKVFDGFPPHPVVLLQYSVAVSVLSKRTTTAEATQSMRLGTGG